MLLSIDENGLFRIKSDEVMTPDLLSEIITTNKRITTERYSELGKAYKNKYKIFELPAKPCYKPDNRIAVNFAKYIVDVFNGFFIGNPIKVETLDDTVKAYVETLEAYNTQDDLNSELSKASSIYGKAYELYYVDNSANICVAVSSPTNSVMVYDDGIVPKPKYFVRYYKGADNIERGSFSDDTSVYYFENNGTLKIDWEGGKTHGFQYVPANEMCDNDERQGIFESEMPMIDAYNKAISEKANDVDAFADAYLKVLGPRLDDEETRTLRQDRIINIETDNLSGVDVDFMQKPSADATQENLINRLERLIFNISMVANISDENFATSSGIALRYKLKAMSDLANTKKRKFEKLLNNRYKVIFSNPISGMSPDSWVTLRYIFNFNYPANLAEEVDIAAKMQGITSKRTSLSVISAIDNVDDELAQIDNENDETEYNTDYAVNRTVDDELLGTADEATK